MSVVQMSTQRAAAWTPPNSDRWCGQDAGRPTGCAPDYIEEALMPSKLRRTRITLQAKAYRSAVALAGLLVLLEALGAPLKL